MGDIDYRDFVDSSLIKAADAQDPPGLGIVDIISLWGKKADDFPKSWFQAITFDLEKQGLGKSCATDGDSAFLINGAGLRRAAEIRSEQAPKPWHDKVATEKVQRLINLGNFLIALLALVVAATAIIRS